MRAARALECTTGSPLSYCVPSAQKRLSGKSAALNPRRKTDDPLLRTALSPRGVFPPSRVYTTREAAERRACVERITEELVVAAITVSAAVRHWRKNMEDAQALQRIHAADADLEELERQALALFGRVPPWPRPSEEDRAALEKEKK